MLRTPPVKATRVIIARLRGPKETEGLRILIQLIFESGNMRPSAMTRSSHDELSSLHSGLR